MWGRSLGGPLYNWQQFVIIAPMVLQNHIILIGPMAAGKTSVAKLLADLLDIPYIDIDILISTNTNRAIAEIFVEQGEAEFRALEAAALKASLAQNPSIIATGAGIVTATVNQNIISKQALIFYLQASVKNQILRVNKDNKIRPMLLDCKSQQKRIKDLFLRRKKLYSNLAKIIISTDNFTAIQVADLIVKYLDEKISL